MIEVDVKMVHIYILLCLMTLQSNVALWSGRTNSPFTWIYLIWCIKRKHVYKRGRYSDMWIMQITPLKWQPKNTIRRWHTFFALIRTRLNDKSHGKIGHVCNLRMLKLMYFDADLKYTIDTFPPHWPWQFNKKKLYSRCGNKFSKHVY